MVELRPYQQEAINAIRKEWGEHQSTLLVLPTGCGKTICFGKIAEEEARDGRVLILAHREELLTQAADKIRKISGLECSVEKAERSCLDGDEQITVGSVQTLQNERRLSRFPNNFFRTIVIDEAHHSLAPSYRHIIDHFDTAKLLGVTATPDRGDMKNLGEIYESLAYEYSLRDAVKQGYLCKIAVQTLPLNIDMTAVKVQAGDYQAGDIGHALEPYLEDIADQMADVCKDRHTVVFLPLVSIAQEFRDILNRKGFRAAEVNGESKNRDEILREFEEGKFNVLCNAMLLTEGWDCPIVDCIVVLRPTKIRSLYSQMIGRGTRLYPGKNELLVLDFLWMTGRHNLVHPADLICKKAEIAEKVTEKLEDGEIRDLFEAEEGAERDAVEERKSSLAKALDESKNERKKKKLVDPLEFGLSIDNDELIDYVPTFGWEAMDPTEKQLATIEKFGVSTDGILNRGHASLVIDTLMKRVGMATPKQIQLLERFGFQSVKDWTIDEAKSVIAQVAAVNWQIWKCHIVPEFYLPERLRKEAHEQFT